MKKRKICFFITNRAHYSRQKRLIEELENKNGIELHLIYGGSFIVPKYGTAVFKEVEKGKHKNGNKIYSVIEGGDNISMAKTAGLMLLESINIINSINPDIILLRGDRFEVLPIALAGAYLNKVIAHIEGGDLSGTIDESVRHAITKMSHIHFTTNDEAHKRVLQLGENPRYVYNFGSPDVEYASSIKIRPSQEFIDNTATGSNIDISKPYIIVIQHPVTTETDNSVNATKTLNAVRRLNLQTIWFWPNMDAGSNEISKVIRMFKEHVDAKTHKISFVKELESDKFISLLKYSECIIGNSSAGIKESSFFGVPSVNIGTRQDNRLKPENVLDVSYDEDKIVGAIKKQLKHGKYKPSSLYVKKDTSKNIARVLKEVPLYLQKKFFIINK